MIIGSVRAYEEDGTCFIGKVIVDPEHQNRGMGTELMRSIEARFKNAKRFELFTGKHSEKNLHFYRKLGYSIFKTERLTEKVTLNYLEKPNKSVKMDEIRARFDKGAPVYDFDIITVIPYYNEMLDTTVKSIPFEKTKKIKVLDLGCGTGNLTRQIKLAFPNSSIICLDISETMIEQACKKLKKFDEISFLIQDFNDLSFQESFDVIISSLALHHLISDDDKKDIYRRIYQLLNNKGVFLNFDNILGSNNSIQERYLNVWNDFLKKSFPEEQVLSILKKHHEEDRPAKIFDQLKWLEEIGFKDVDVIVKYYNFAVYGGFKY